MFQQMTTATKIAAFGITCLYHCYKRSSNKKLQLDSDRFRIMKFIMLDRNGVESKYEEFKMNDKTTGYEYSAF